MRKTIVITGGAGVLGKGITRAISDKYDVLILDNNVNSLMDEDNGVFARTVDITDPPQVKEALHVYLQDGGKPFYGLVNCVGISPKNNGIRHSIENTTIEEWESVMKINLTGMFIACQQMAPYLKELRVGRIVNVGSLAGRTQSSTAGVHYTTSKAGVLGLTRALASELASHNITVNAIAPGKVENPNWPEDAEKLMEYKREIPLGRIAKSQDIAGTVAFLLSEDAGFITGTTIDINGGKLMI